MIKTLINRLLLNQMCLVGMLAMFLVSSLARAEEGEGVVEPYEVYVAHEAVYARCGPNGDYYRTDPLPLGQKLDVYLEAEDGWLGIRPPENSFSWIQAAKLEVSHDGETGTVIDSSAVAWIGTHLGRASKYRWQVPLPQGEQVVIIGKKERHGPKGSTLWYKIVPPSGEFRWVHQSQVVDSVVQLVDMHRDSSADQPQPTPATAVSDPQSKDKQPQQGTDSKFNRVVDSLDSHPIGSSLRQSVHVAEIPQGLMAEDRANHSVQSQEGQHVSTASPQREITASPSVKPEVIHSRWVPTTSIRSAPIPAQKAADQTDNKGSWPQLRPADPPILRRVGSPETQSLNPVANADLKSLHMELSRQMATSSSDVAVEPIRKQAEYWVANLSDPNEQLQARSLLEMIKKYQQIAGRRDEMVQPGPVDQRVLDATTQRPQEDVPKFEKVGYLVQVYSARPKAPAYALNDSAGRVIAYVNPSIGVRLRKYLGKRVGIVGRIGYDTGLNTPLLTADKAIPIGR